MAKGLAEQIRAFSKQHKVDAGDVVRTVMINISTSITNRSPVDRGRYRSNWIASTNTPSSRQLKSLRRDPMKTAVKKIDQAIAKLGVYYFVNNLRYSKAIEYGLYPKNPKRGSKNRKTGVYEIRSKNGYSKQAPNGVVRVAIKKELRRFNKLSKSGRLTTKSSGIRYWDK